MPDRPAAGDQFVQSLARGLDVITAFDAGHPSMTLTEVAARTGLSRAAARRFLLTLTELGYVRSDGRQFTLTPQVLRLGSAFLAGSGLPEICRPHLEHLTAEVGESTSVAVLDGADIVYVARVATRSIMTVGITVGTRFPAHATSLGRVLLAALSPDELDTWLAQHALTPQTESTVVDEAHFRQLLAQVAADGWAASDQQLATGLRSVAAPVTGSAGVLAAVNVSSTTAHDPASEYLAPLLRTAAAISADAAAAL